MFQAINSGINLNFFINLILPVFQIPTEVPHPNNNSPIDLSKPEDVVIYIVIPLVFVILYFIGRRGRNKRINPKSHENQNHL